MIFFILGLEFAGLISISRSEVIRFIPSEPIYITLSEDYSSSSYDSKFGDDFRYHLVSTTSESNLPWWRWSFNYRFKKDDEKDKADDFKNIKDEVALRQKCDEWYRKITVIDIHATDKEANEKSIWRYCSIEGFKPITVRESSAEGQEGYEKIEKLNEYHLISTLDLRNDKFWFIQSRAFFYKTNSLIYKAAGGSSFKALYQHTYRREIDVIRNFCSVAYEKSEFAYSQPQKEALAFCSLKAKVEDL